MDAWLNQILGYLLVDRHDVLLADRISLYLGWQGLLLTIPVPDWRLREQYPTAPS